MVLVIKSGVWRAIHMPPSMKGTKINVPLAAKGKIMIGSSGGEYGIRGFLDAYHADSGERAWREDDPTGPIGVYGQTKLAGEEALAMSGATYAILRTAWVYSPFGNNFVKTMLRLAESRDALNVVHDQFGNPTSALDIADALLAVAGCWSKDPDRGANETYHFAGTGSTSWADFARAIFAESAQHGGPSCAVTGIPASEYPTKAARPANSRLDSAKFAETFGHSAPRWQDSLSETVVRLLD